jgi:hypothetical protein
MNKRLIWVEGDDFTGWCCSHCPWGITAPHLESTVAALAFNRVAHEDFWQKTFPAPSVQTVVSQQRWKICRCVVEPQPHTLHSSRIW